MEEALAGWDMGNRHAARLSWINWDLCCPSGVCVGTPVLVCGAVQVIFKSFRTLPVWRVPLLNVLLSPNYAKVEFGFLPLCMQVPAQLGLRRSDLTLTDPVTIESHLSTDMKFLEG